MEKAHSLGHLHPTRCSLGWEIFYFKIPIIIYNSLNHVITLNFSKKGLRALCTLPPQESLPFDNIKYYENWLNRKSLLWNKKIQSWRWNHIPSSYFCCCFSFSMGDKQLFLESQDKMALLFNFNLKQTPQIS